MDFIEFDNGWGDVPLKSLERHITHSMLGSWIHRPGRTAIINSTWYTDDFHQQVLERLHKDPVDHVVLVAMFDPAIPKADWFRSLGVDVTGVGYYSGPGEVDFWALSMYDNFVPDVYESYLQDAGRIDTAYICLNRKPHVHRRRLYQCLDDRGLLDRGLVSMGGENGQAMRLLPLDQGRSDSTPNPGPEQHGICNDIFTLGHVENWTRCLLNVVTETVWDIREQNFVSEKIYKPILGCRPFSVWAPDCGNQWLKDRGFEPYHDQWRDIMEEDCNHPENLLTLVTRLCDQPATYYQKKFIDLLPQIRYNKERFRHYISEQRSKIQQGISCPI